MRDDTTMTSHVLRLDDVAKQFGAARAVAGVSLALRAGERLGLVGHNGAGKSTLMAIVLGVVRPDRGGIAVGDRTMPPTYDVMDAFAAGVRCVFQELSLCGNLNAYENLALQHRRFRGLGWRRRARAALLAALDDIFPGHGIDLGRPIVALPIGLRQMVEIARAFAEGDTMPRLVVLDEPTSSLDGQTAASLMAFLPKASARGIASILVSHRLHEILDATQRVVVMRDGAIVADRASDELSHEGLVRLMGGSLPAAPRKPPATRAGVEPRLTVTAPRRALAVGAGEVVGLAGLDGHGQRDLLHRIFLGQAAAGERIERFGRLAYVSGDRQRDGVFPLWSVTRNLGIGAMRQLARAGVLRPGAEAAMAATWRDRLGIRLAALDQPILSLSGGNQQKVLIARAFASDAGCILLDDPTRGVDVVTKRELYEQVRAEAARGRAFLWYTTEFDELAVCDRVCVFYEGGVTATLAGAEVTEAAVLRASFAAV